LRAILSAVALDMGHILSVVLSFSNIARLHREEGQVHLWKQIVSGRSYHVLKWQKVL